MRSGDLDGMLVFITVAERRSFTAAAAQLRVTRSAVSQSIKALEQKMGVALFARTTRDVGLTEAGRLLYDQVAPAVRAIGQALEAVGDYAGRPSGLLRLTVPRMAIPTLIAPLLPGFCAAYPDIVIEIHGDDALANIVEDGFDAGIRLGELVEQDMVSVRLTPPMSTVVVGSPDYFRRHGRPATPQDLVHHACINWRSPSRGGLYRWEFERNGEEFDVAVDGPLIVNEAGLSLQAAIDGLGLSYGMDHMAQPFIDRGLLETTLDTFAAHTPGLFLYFPARAQVLPKLRAFIDYAVRQTGNQ